MKTKLLVVILFVILLSSCGKQNSIEQIRYKLSRMNSYEAEVEITVFGENNNSKYTVKQYYKYPDKLRLEFIEPSFLNGQVILYNSRRWTSYNPSIGMEISIEGVKEEQDYINTGFLLKSIGDIKKDNYTKDTIDGVEYAVIKSPIPDATMYRKQVAVYFESMGGTPAYMNITDSKGKLRVNIKYIRFIYNADIKDEMFIDAKPK